MKSPEDLEQILKSGAKVVANSDAHHYSKIGVFSVVEEALKIQGAELSTLENYAKAPEFPRRKLRLKE
jgi:histidinol phosphatase-like PHP family hydrolase